MNKTRLIKKKSGHIVITTLVVLFFLFVAVISLIEPIQELFIQNKLDANCRAALLKIEADGGLTSETEEIIRKNLKNEGLEVNDLEILCDKNKEPSNKTYGQNVTLKLVYRYKQKNTRLNGFGIKQEEETKVAKSQYSTTTKN